MKLRISRKHVPVLATIAVAILLYAVAGLLYRDKGFLSVGVLLNFFTDNAVLGIAALGMTFVILSGGIDLSIGAVIGFTSMLLATLMAKYHWHPAPAIAVSLAVGSLFGAGMGAVIRYFMLPPFLVTLAGMFLARGASFIMKMESIPIEHPFYSSVSEKLLPLGGGNGLPVTALIFIGGVLLALVLAHYTSFGRNIYALGGNEASSLLMGLPVGRTKIMVYALSGGCAALAGVVYTLYTFSGNPTAGSGLELDAIAAVVIGGTLLSGGVGYVAGTVVGVLILGIIQTGLSFQGTLSSWWTRIAIGLLLLLFILLQKVLQPRK